MKTMKKRIISLALALTLGIFSTTTAFATTPNTYSATSSDVTPRTPMDYAGIWLDKEDLGSFTISNSRNGSTGVTFKVESSNVNSYATMWLVNPNGNTVVGSQHTIRPADGDVYFRITGIKGTYKVMYQGFPKQGAGMRLMCWMYD